VHRAGVNLTGTPIFRKPLLRDPASGIGRPQILVIITTFVVGLYADVHTNILGQLSVSICVWALLFYLLNRVDRHQRYVLMACLTIATAGEMFCSLSWGLYTYRLHNIPMFVPPGHVLLLLLGLAVAPRMTEVAARAIIGGAAIYALAGAATGVDTLALPLFAALATASLAMPRHRRLFASTFVLSLALELYGTWLGNWAWSPTVPGMALVTTNPPGVSGAFYCALDAMVAAASSLLVPRWTGSAV